MLSLYFPLSNTYLTSRCRRKSISIKKYLLILKVVYDATACGCVLNFVLNEVSNQLHNQADKNKTRFLKHSCFVVFLCKTWCKKRRETLQISRESKVIWSARNLKRAKVILNHPSRCKITWKGPWNSLICFATRLWRVFEISVITSTTNSLYFCSNNLWRMPFLGSSERFVSIFNHSLIAVFICYLKAEKKRNSVIISERQFRTQRSESVGLKLIFRVIDLLCLLPRMYVSAWNTSRDLAWDKKKLILLLIDRFEVILNNLVFCFVFVRRILVEQEKPFNVRYDFIFNRCRAVRQEIVIQNFSCSQTVALLEPISMFLSYSLYRLSGSPISVFDEKICRQHLQECLLKCLTCYEEMDSLEQRSYSVKTRDVVEGIYLMLNIDDSNALQRAIKSNLKLKSNRITSFSIKIALNFHLRNFFKVLRDIQELPDLVSGIASLILPRVRQEILRIFSIAYHSSQLSVPFDFIQRLLIYDNCEDLKHDLINLGLHESINEASSSVKFDRKKFNTAKSVVSWSWELNQFTKSIRVWHFS